MRRREFIILLVGMSVIRPGAASSPQGKPPRVAYLTPRTGSGPSSYDEAFMQGLRALGYVPGESVDYHWVGEPIERLPTAAAELVSAGVDVLVASGSAATAAAKRATAHIPIVTITSDPVGSKHVTNLARPGGNVTGRSLLGTELGSKRLEILKEAVPAISRVAVLFSNDNPSARRSLKEANEAAPKLGLEIVAVPVRPNGFEDALTTAAHEKAAGAVLLSQGQTVNPDTNFQAIILKHRLPIIFTSKSFVVGGGLMSYGPDVAEVYRQTARHVDRILKGANPGDLPVEAPTKFELVINLKTAAALGLTIPSTLLARADEVIE